MHIYYTRFIFIAENSTLTTEIFTYIKKNYKQFVIFEKISVTKVKQACSTNQ